MGLSSASRSVLTVMLLNACSSSTPTQAPRGTAERAALPPAPIAPLISLSPLTITFDGQPIARLFADGRTESVGPNAPGAALTPGPTLHADGTILLTKGGVIARIDDKGDIYVGGRPGADPPARLIGHIAGDALTYVGSARPWDVRVRGNLIEFGEQNSSEIEGDDTPSMRHTALVMAAAYYLENAIAAP